MVLIRLKIRLVDGRDTVINADNETTIGELRQEIQKSVQIPSDHQRLIFRGKVLEDNARKLHDCGIEDDMAIHVVERQPQQRMQSQSQQSGPSEGEQQGQGNVPAGSGSDRQYSVTQSLIIGEMPIERTALFQEPNNALLVVGDIIQQMSDRYRMDTTHRLQMGRPQNNDFSIEVSFRGIRHQFMDSPARGRFEALRGEMQKLAWLVAIIKSQFLDEVEAVLANEEPADETWAFNRMAAILRAMNAFDHFDDNMVNYVIRDSDAELDSMVEGLEQLELADDEAHLEQVNPTLTIRHCTSLDLRDLMVWLTVVDAKVTEHLLNRYHRVLSMRHTLPSSSYAARLLNCFCNAVTRVQHFRAHIYHTLSDLTVHVDDNPHNRLYPQLSVHLQRHQEPPQANISLIFFDPSHVHNAAPAAPSQLAQNIFRQSRPPQMQQNRPETAQQPQRSQQQQQQPPSAATPRSALNSVLDGFFNFAQQLVGVGGMGTVPPPPPPPRSATSSSSASASMETTSSASPSTIFTSTPNNDNNSMMGTSPALQDLQRQLDSVGPPPPPFNGNSDFHLAPPNVQQPQQQQRSFSADRAADPATFSPPSRGFSGRPTRLPRPAGAGMPPQAMGLPYDLAWGRTSPEAPNAMFIGQNPPANLPMFTMDPYLTCASRRYRVFEMDSRHNDFWNDPGTMERGLEPPHDSITSMYRRSQEQQQQQQGHNNNQEMPMEVDGTGPNVVPLLPPQRTIATAMRRRRGGQSSASSGSNNIAVSAPSMSGGENASANPAIHPSANTHGEAVFTNMAQFEQYVRQTFETIANCMARYDSRISPQTEAAQRQRFTANSRVSGFFPFFSMPTPFQPPMPPHFGPPPPPPTAGAGGPEDGTTFEAVITFSVPAALIQQQQQNQQPAPSNGAS